MTKHKNTLSSTFSEQESMSPHQRSASAHRGSASAAAKTNAASGSIAEDRLDATEGSTGAKNAVIRDLQPGSDTLPPNLLNLVECPGLSDIHDYGFGEDAPDMTLPTDARQQDSDYSADNKAAPANNLFFLERSNPLSSKGD
ncbi:MAG: hypothetical protein K2N94_01380 [Lachnospiraceae bacterium]|nr:hypothetical protein [Lachnospiraceae bacterium]